MRTIALKRRNFLGGVLAVSAPAIIRTPGLLMPIKVRRLDWVPCDGRALSCTQYPGLFAAIGTVYGRGVANTFLVPDLRARKSASPLYMIAARHPCIPVGSIVSLIPSIHAT